MTLKDTGERMVPAFHKGLHIYGEHIVRYEGILSLLKNKRVLDIACGSGYGSKILAKSARHVVGVDLSADSIQYAKQKYSANNIEYLVGSATDIPLDSSQFDAVVSYETIEHLDDPTRFIKEAKRVLKDDGVLFVSTPNKDEFTEGNHFHLHEFREAEFVKKLSSSFRNVQLYYQGTWLYTDIMREEEFEKEWRKQLAVEKSASPKRKNAVYFIAVCSDDELPDLSYLGSISELWSEKEYLESKRANERRLSELEDLLRNNEAKISELYVSAETARLELKAVKSSLSWRLTYPLRIVKRLIRYLVK